MATIEPLLLTATRIMTFLGGQHLTNATGFFFSRGPRLFLITSRHVMFDEESEHRPERLEIELHTDVDNVAEVTGYSIPLYRDGERDWRQGVDAAGEIDVAAIELDRDAMPETAVYQAFTPEHLPSADDETEVGTPLLLVGFPLGFYDTLHHVAVVRHAIVASSFGFRFQGQGYFLTDGRTHRGSSGAAVVARSESVDGPLAELPWKLLGIHSARLDVGGRDIAVDEALGLNCAWYSDILMTLTED